MIITPSAISSLFVNLDYRFSTAMKDADAQSFYRQVAMEADTSTKITQFPLFDRAPGGLRKWQGERVKQGASIFPYTITVDKYEATMNLKREDVEDNQLDIARLTADAIGYQTAIFPDKQIATLLEAGTAAANTTYDGVPFFSASHPVDTSGVVSGTQTNLHTSKPLTANNLATVLTSLRSLKGADNNPMGIGRRLTLMVPPALEWTARTILNTGMIAPTTGVGGNANSIAVSNVFQNAADLIVNPWLTSATTWYVFDLSQPLKPFLFVWRKRPEFTWLNANDDQNVFWHDEYVYGVRVRAAAGFGLWFLAARAEA